MRILHTIPGRNWGGMEHRTLEQVRWLADHGYAVWLASPPDGETYQRAERAGLPTLPVVFDRPWSSASVRSFRKLVRDYGIDVIDTHVTRDAKVAMACLDLCAVVRSRHVNQPLKPSLIRKAQWRLGADHIITVAEVTRQGLMEIGLASARRSVSIGGWADEAFFDGATEQADRGRLRAEWQVDPAEPLILCVGMLRPDKGQDHLIRALGRLSREGRRFSCVLAGNATAESADFARQLDELIASEGLDGRVRLLGYRDDIPALMKAADLVVIASLTEAQPRVGVQAFASRRPLVATAVGGVPEIVRDGVTGWLVPPEDAPALARAIAKVLDDPAQAAAIAAKARAVAEASMRFDQRMAQTLATYEIAIRRAKGRVLPPLMGTGR